MTIDFQRGHATGNDFVIIEDTHGMLDLSAGRVAALCDRRFGIGGDGLLRVVRAEHVEDWDGPADVWFMDYRNADGSIAEMCGNGLRLFARYLQDRQLQAEPQFQVATRAGLKAVDIRGSENVTVDLGPVRIGRTVNVQTEAITLEATSVDVGNPHAVAWVSAAELDALDLDQSPRWEPATAFPDGVNLEFVNLVRPGVLSMRVYERGVGETLSCGTGVVAAAAVYAHQHQWQQPVEVRVPGGRLSVELTSEAAWLSGPAIVTTIGRFFG